MDTQPQRNSRKRSSRRLGQESSRPRGATRISAPTGSAEATEQRQDTRGMADGMANYGEGQTPTQDRRQSSVEAYAKTLRRPTEEHGILLPQLRTEHSWLASYAKIRRFGEEDKCVCGARETVVHVLVDCPNLRELRQKLRNKIGDAFNNIALMLGGRPSETQKGKQWSIDTEVINAVLEFAQESQRFQSR